MIQLLFFDYLTIQQRRVTIWFTTVFLIFESVTLLCYSAHYWLAYALGVGAAFLAGLMSGSRNVFSPKDIETVAILDALLYASVVFATTFLTLDAHVSQMSNGSFFRIDCELFAIALGVLIVAILWPSGNDIYWFRRLRPDEAIRAVERIPTIPFGFRRCLTSGVALLILGVIGLICLCFSPGWLASLLIIIIVWAFMLFAFEYTYGYRSFIMRFFGSSLFATVIIALLIQTGHRPWFPPIAVRWIAAAWFGFWMFAMTQIWRNTRQWILVEKQVFGHTGFLGSLGIGHFVIYVLWIDPIFVHAA